MIRSAFSIQQVWAALSGAVLIVVFILALPRVTAPMLNNFDSVQWLRASMSESRGKLSEQDRQTFERWVRLAREVDPSFAPALYREGQIAHMRGQIDKAADLLQQAANAQPQNAIWQNSLGNVRAQQSQWLDAGQAWYFAGHTHERLLYDYRKWLAFAIAASRAEPSRAADYRAIAFNLINVQAIDQEGHTMALAASVFDTLHQVPDEPWFLNVLAVSFRWDEPERAISIAQRGLALAPDDASILMTLGSLYIQVDQPEQALPTLLAARKAGIPDSDGSWLHMMGAAMLRLGDLAPASDYLLRAEQQSPSSVSIQMSLGEMYERAGDKARALNHYERALTLAPEAEYARQAVERLRGK